MMRRHAPPQPSCSRLLRNFLNVEASSSSATSSTLPLYLCPAAARRASTLARRRPVVEARERRTLPLRHARGAHAEAAEERDAAIICDDDGNAEQLAPRAEAAPVRESGAEVTGVHGGSAVTKTNALFEPVVSRAEPMLVLKYHAETTAIHDDVPARQDDVVESNVAETVPVHASHAKATEGYDDVSMGDSEIGPEPAVPLAGDEPLGEAQGEAAEIYAHVVGSQADVSIEPTVSIGETEIYDQADIRQPDVTAEPTEPILDPTASVVEPIAPIVERSRPTIESSAPLIEPTVPSVEPIASPTEPVIVRQLPVQCHGCGALSQTAVPGTAGFYDLNRKPVQVFLGLFKEEESRGRSEDDIVRASLRSLSAEQLKELGINPEVLKPDEPKEENALQPAPRDPQVPLCDRCHELVYHHTGTSIYHPTIEAIRDTLSESPYKYNHVYHILDAADFPMSLLPKVHQLLDLMPLRTKNRRSSAAKFFKGKQTEMSFIITRSDLLAPKKEAVDRMMPYLVETLRDALPRDSRHVRLGNVRCVSAKRGWWTKELREDIWNRGGAGWMVGKVNVGKSQLFHEVFPKGRMDWKQSKHDISIDMEHKDREKQQITRSSVLQELNDLDEDALLPPAQEEKQYPQMPVVSALPGTTASPIRVPFGGGKGELIDLPGLARSDLENLIREEHRHTMIMKARITPEQYVIKPGRSLLIGGFIRITPRTPDLIFLGYNFTPLKEHMCGTEKAIAIQKQTGDVNVENIALPETADKIKLAGSFPLKYDVTKRRAGPITRKDAVGMKVENLPYRVLSIDILIEGCGWVEITAQVRARELYKKLPKPTRSSNVHEPETLDSMGLSGSPRSTGTQRANFGDEEILQSLDLSDLSSRPRPSPRDRWQDRSQDRSRDRRRHEPEPPQRQDEEELNWPVVDVYSPYGRFVGCRQPMNAWLLNRVRKTPQTSKQRPRKSMTGAKKREKQARR